MSEQSSTVRNIYFYLVSLVALGFIVGSSVYLLNYVAKVTVFTQGEVSGRYTPPPLVLSPKTEATDASLSKVSCTPDCTLTENDRTSINDWEAQYKTWQTQPTTSTNTQRGLVNALSFLIVALPIFFFHFRTAQRDYRKESGQPAGAGKHSSFTLRSVYFYFVALAAVVMFIISAGVSVNTALKTWVIKDTASDLNQPIAAKSIDGRTTSETEGVETLLACADKCNISAEQKTLLTQWQQDYTSAKAEIDAQQSHGWQRTMASSLPFLLVSIPLFWLHWTVIQRERTKTTRSSP
ncbi:MAG: DUF5671 domain-containing protein [Patescibacteria group bacterium]